MTYLYTFFFFLESLLLFSTNPQRKSAVIGGHLKMAECLAARLTAQEEQILLLTKEISTLRDGLCHGLDAAGVAVVSRELENLRAENEKLRYRLLHLRRGLQAELELEEAQGKRQQGAKCDKAPAKNTEKAQQTNSRADNNRVIIQTGAVQIILFVT